MNIDNLLKSVSLEKEQRPHGCGRAADYTHFELALLTVLCELDDTLKSVDMDVFDCRHNLECIGDNAAEAARNMR